MREQIRNYRRHRVEDLQHAVQTQAAAAAGVPTFDLELRAPKAAAGALRILLFYEFETVLLYTVLHCATLCRSAPERTGAALPPVPDARPHERELEGPQEGVQIQVRAHTEYCTVRYSVHPIVFSIYNAIHIQVQVT